MLTPLESFMSVNGDQTLRLNYDLNEDSVVFDLGGYQGAWSDAIFERYHCKIHIFEPATIYADLIANRFANNGNIILHRFGLADSNRRCQLAVLGDASSIFHQTEQMIEINLVKASHFFEEYQIRAVDLMKINIEGSEYELLEHLLESNLVSRIIDIQVQFHDIFPTAEKRMKAIQTKLKKTHNLTYQYKFVWENWRRVER